LEEEKAAVEKGSYYRRKLPWKEEAAVEGGSCRGRRIYRGC
jgi:hypothetical protein